MPTFCRHNRFIERCLICSREAEEAAAATRPPARRAPRAGAGPRRPGTPTRVRAQGAMRVRRELRSEDDGYRSGLVPGLRASADAERLADEISFSCARLLLLAAEPPGPYAQARALGVSDPARAGWICFVAAYLSPLPGDAPFTGIEAVIAGGADALAGAALGPRTSHDPVRGPGTLDAYRQWLARAADGTNPFAGDPLWSAERRFERLYERLALPGLARAARYELLVSLGRLGISDVNAGSLHLVQSRGEQTADATPAAAKRVFGIGDPLLLERRAAGLAAAAGVPLAALDLALFNWAGEQCATMGVAADVRDEAALDGARAALGLTL